jgi:hypothetical protein
MSLDDKVEDTHVSGCQAIDALIQDSIHSKYDSLKWIPNSEFIGIESIQNFIGQNFSYAIHEKWSEIILILLGNDDKCTLAFINEFARMYSLPTHKYKNPTNRMEFRRYAIWLQRRNRTIKGFTKHDGNYYLVAERRFRHFYSRYGFCSTCGILRCSSVWCICRRKELSDAWTSNHEKLDGLIKESQIQTSSANDAYVEWIPFDYIKLNEESSWFFNGLPTFVHLKLIPLDIVNDADDFSYYEKVISDYVFYI